MALSCQVSLNYSAYSAGQNPPPMATLFVYNPSAVAVSVTGVQMHSSVVGDANVNRLAMSPSVPPIGPGMTTSVPSLSSINIGPFPVVVGSAANVDSFQAVNQSGNLNPINPQGSQPAQYALQIGATVQGSDGSSNEAGVAPLFVSYTAAPPQAFQGGYLQFASPNNLVAALIPGVL